MKILVLTPTFLPIVGGAEMVLFEVYRRLAGRHEVELLSPVPPPALVRDHASPEYDALVPFPVERYVDRVSFMKLRGHRFTAGAIPPFSLSAVTAVRRAVRRFRPDVLNVHYLMPTGLAGVVAERCLGVPTVLSLSGRDAPGPGVPPLWRWWQCALVALVTDATYVSGYCRTALHGAGRGRGVVVYAGVEIPPPGGDATAVRRALGVPPSVPLIFALQRLAPEKRVDVLLHALRRFLDRGGRGVLVLGGTGPEAERLRALARDLAVEPAVRFAGYIPRQELASYFLAADLFLFHSTFETFGIVLAQAMSYGCPIVSVKHTAIPEVVGDAGMLVEPGDPDANGASAQRPGASSHRLGDAMAAVLGDEAYRRRLAASGRERARALFDWDRIAEQYEAVLARAAAGGGARRAGAGTPASATGSGASAHGAS